MAEAAIAQFQVAKMILDINLDGITHEESLVGPDRGGNCINWVVGHMVTAYNHLLPAIGGESVWVVERAAALTPEELAAAAPYSPVSNPEETIGSLIGLLAFHQSYHTGQTGILRRMVGRDSTLK